MSTPLLIEGYVAATDGSGPTVAASVFELQPFEQRRSLPNVSSEISRAAITPAYYSNNEVL
uniref:Uncharacterized protein n=1 Tax=Timema poppense TaxID=170557 RepID=A0A7R9CUA4_TIMPO|nr:unnamed protein product [Timema poppensis]